MVRKNYERFIFAGVMRVFEWPSKFIFEKKSKLKNKFEEST